MGQIKDILIETRDWAQEMQDAAEKNCLARAQYSCQIWNLGQMIKFIDGIEHLRDRWRRKQR